MKRYLIYFLKKRLHVVLILSVIMITIISVALSNTNFIYEKPIWDAEYNHIVRYQKVADNVPIAYLTVFACLLVSIVPIFEFSFKMKKISVDQQYSLPIKREKLYLTKYLVGLYEILIPLTIAYLWMILMIITKENLFNMGYIYLYYPILLFLSIVIYTIICFVYTRGNTVADGIMNIIFYIFLGFVFLMIFYTWDLPIGDHNSYFFLYSPHTCANRIFRNLIENKTSTYKTIDLISMLFYTVVAIIFFILFLILNKKEKSENSMQISESYFSYKTMIPYYAIVCSAFSTDSALVLAFVFTGAYILYATYKRSFKLAKKDLIKLVIIYITCIIFAIISNQIAY